LLVPEDGPTCVTSEEGVMRKIRTVRDLPLFPLVPILPAALVVGSLATAIQALVRVRRLERRLASTMPG
jgi:hypothetical protein